MADLVTVPADIDTASATQVAAALDTSEAGLAQMRYRGTGPRFVKRGRRVLYRWSDVRAYLEANTCQRTDDVPVPVIPTTPVPAARQPGASGHTKVTGPGTNGPRGAGAA